MTDRSEQSDNAQIPVASRVRALTPRAIALGGVILAVVAAGVVWLLLAVGVGTAQLDAIRTAGTLVVGAGGAVALLLAARRQRTTELELEQKYEAAQDARFDATERRITELYIKAADQLGSDKAPVRLAGLYALERLAQDTTRLRQTIVNVICSYLRMPYTMPTTTRTVPRPLGRRRKVRPGQLLPSVLPAAVPQLDPAYTGRQEREVRLTAQNILTTHLVPGPDPEHPVETFWADIDLDLTDAILINVNLRDCHMGIGRFEDATFFGETSFAGATLTGDAWFTRATFTEYVDFAGARFSGQAVFTGTSFNDTARFHSTTFTSTACFDDATFERAEFTRAAFTETADFHEATFTATAEFDGATFTRDAVFVGATFSGDAQFAYATFSDAAGFTGATFEQLAMFSTATFTGLAAFADGTFDRGVPDELARFVADDTTRMTVGKTSLRAM